MTKNQTELVRFEETNKNIVETPHNLGVQDAKGREIGAIIKTYIATRVEIPGDSCGMMCDKKYMEPTLPTRFMQLATM